MPSLAFRKASICSRFSFSASCTLVVNPQHATAPGSSCIGNCLLLQAHLVLEKTLVARCVHIDVHLGPRRIAWLHSKWASVSSGNGLPVSWSRIRRSPSLGVARL